MARRFLFVATAAALLRRTHRGGGRADHRSAERVSRTGHLRGQPSSSRSPRVTRNRSIPARCSRRVRTQPIVDAAVANGPPSGNGVLLGTTDGRIVVSESIHVFPNAQGREAVRRDGEGVVELHRIRRARLAQPGLRAVPATPAARRPSRRQSTVPARPPRRPSTGRATAAPLSGVTALIAWDHYVAETSIRIAVPKPGELTALSQSVLGSASYDGRSATGAATRSEAIAAGRRTRGRPSSRAPQACPMPSRQPGAAGVPDEPTELPGDRPTPTWTRA